ncbi:MAG TPA: Gfo/Idh/MocA family oxidoreductase [Candidatus Dormibacteraeota bacterium]|jgi:predicted dehydrogenase|nr:Gfo/Idh/MocA family oxidoreductase [Candidatus Dormibacteraeota bacterium]
MDQLRVVQVGLGGWGRDWAQRVIPEVAEVDLVGYVDSEPNALARLRDVTPIAPAKCFLTLGHAIEATKPEAVLVTATLPGHAPVTRAALAAGLHVLVEKPFAESLDVARQLVELAAAKRKVLMVSQNYRFFPAARKVAQLVSEAQLGKLHEVSIDFRRYSPGTVNGRGRHHVEDQPLLVDMSIHHFDLLRLILQREPERIYCEAWNPEWSGFSGPSVAVSSIQFGAGIVGSYRGSWVSTGPVTPWSGEWRMDFEHGHIFWTSRDDEGARYDRVVIQKPEGKPRVIPLPALAQTDRWGTLAEFARAVREGREPECSGRDNLGTLAMVAAAVESAKQGQPIDISTKQVRARLAI